MCRRGFARTRRARRSACSATSTAGREQPRSSFPGWPYSFVAVLEPGATSWTAILDAVRLGPVDDATAITAAQLRGVVERLFTAGQWRAGDLTIVIVSDAGYDVTCLAWVLREPPVQLVGRVRSDRVMLLPEPPRMHSVNGRPPKHGSEFRFTNPETWPEPAITTITDTTNYGKAETQAWERIHSRLTHRSSWLEHEGELPLAEGTLIRLKVEHLSKERDARRCGYGPRRPAPPRTTWTASGRRSSVISTWTTPSASRNRPSGGRPPNSAPPRLRTAGPGS
ncbi:transposase [Streptomyces sp. BE147]|uniref:transposase n=1 Tax=Streptomyces sp. BE147 TaxID=3002524 RepID=UPI003FA6E5CA